MIKREGTVKNAHGIHCRPSAVVSEVVKGYTGFLEVCNQDGQKADPRSVLELLSLAMTCGNAFSVMVDGPDEEKICDALVAALESEYDFQKR